MAELQMILVKARNVNLSIDITSVAAGHFAGTFPMVLSW